MSKLSRYSMRSLSETKPSGRTRKCLITFCLGGKVSFYFIKISHSYYLLPSFSFTFFACESRSATIPRFNIEY